MSTGLEYTFQDVSHFSIGGNPLIEAASKMAGGIEGFLEQLDKHFDVTQLAQAAVAGITPMAFERDAKMPEGLEQVVQDLIKGGSIERS